MRHSKAMIMSIWHNYPLELIWITIIYGNKICVRKNLKLWIWNFPSNIRFDSVLSELQLWQEVLKRENILSRPTGNLKLRWMWYANDMWCACRIFYTSPPRRKTLWLAGKFDITGGILKAPYVVDQSPPWLWSIRTWSPNILLKTFHRLFMMLQLHWTLNDTVTDK